MAPAIVVVMSPMKQMNQLDGMLPSLSSNHGCGHLLEAAFWRQHSTSGLRPTAMVGSYLGQVGQVTVHRHMAMHMSMWLKYIRGIRVCEWVKPKKMEHQTLCIKR